MKNKEDKEEAKKMRLYEGESDPVLLQETDQYCIVELTYNSFCENIRMIRLELKINGQYIFIIRFEKDTIHLPYNYNSRTLSRLLLECINAQVNGYFTKYSGKLEKNEVHGDEYGAELASPLAEIDNRMMYDKPDELRKGFVSFDHIGHGIYSFNGNHEHYSGAFWYLVWNKDMVEKIKEHLQQNKQILFVSRD